MHSLLCWYCMRLGRSYYVIWTFHVLSLYIMFLSHLLFLCVAVYLSRLLSSLTISSLFFFSNCNFNYERERAFEIHVKRSRTVKSCFVFLRTYTTHTPSTRRTAGSSLQVASMIATVLSLWKSPTPNYIIHLLFCFYDECLCTCVHVCACVYIAVIL